MYSFTRIELMLIHGFHFVVNLYGSLWEEPEPSGKITPRTYKWPYKMEKFVTKYDSLQQKLKKLEGADDLLGGNV